MIDLSHYMPDCNDLVPRKLLAEIIQARVEELFEMVHEEIKKSGYDGLLPAGLVVTGGTAELPGILDVAGQILDLPARMGSPLGLHGLADSISRPAYATSVGLCCGVCAIPHSFLRMKKMSNPARETCFPGWVAGSARLYHKDVCRDEKTRAGQAPPRFSVNRQCGRVRTRPYKGGPPCYQWEIIKLRASPRFV